MKIKSIKVSEIFPSDTKELNNLFTTVINHNFSSEGFSSKLYQDIISKEIERQNVAVNNDLSSKRDFDHFLSARYNNKIIGTIAYGGVSKTILENIPNNKIKNRQTIKEIKSLYILPEFQRKGIGSLLLKHILIEMHQAGIKTFYLYSGSKTGQMFWSKKLNKPSIVLKGYFNKNVNCLIWHKQVKDILKVSE